MPTPLAFKLIAEYMFQPDQWAGRFEDPYGQYEVEFPEPGKVHKATLIELMNGACFRFCVDYSGGLKACVVMSSLPKGRTHDEEIAIQHKLSITTQEQLGRDLNIKIIPTSALGDVLINHSSNEIAEPGEGELFPFAGAIFDTPTGVVVSVATHAMFVRDRNRFEVAVVQTLPQGTVPSEMVSEAMAQNVNYVLNEVLNSMAR